MKWVPLNANLLATEKWQQLNAIELNPFWRLCLQRRVNGLCLLIFRALHFIHNAIPTVSTASVRQMKMSFSNLGSFHLVWSLLANALLSFPCCDFKETTGNKSWHTSWSPKDQDVIEGAITYPSAPTKFLDNLTELEFTVAKPASLISISTINYSYSISYIICMDKNVPLCPFWWLGNVGIISNHRWDSGKVVNANLYGCPSSSSCSVPST